METADWTRTPWMRSANQQIKGKKEQEMDLWSNFLFFKCISCPKPLKAINIYLFSQHYHSLTHKTIQFLLLSLSLCPTVIVHCTAKILTEKNRRRTFMFKKLKTSKCNN